MRSKSWALPGVAPNKQKFVSPVPNCYLFMLPSFTVRTFKPSCLRHRHFNWTNELFQRCLKKRCFSIGLSVLCSWRRFLSQGPFIFMMHMIFTVIFSLLTPNFSFCVLLAFNLCMEHSILHWTLGSPKSKSRSSRACAPFISPELSPACWN